MYNCIMNRSFTFLSLHRLFTQSYASKVICSRKLNSKFLKGFSKILCHSYSTVIGEDLSPLSDMNANAHCPVLCEEVVDFLNIKENGKYLDMTFGAGGHSKAILQKCSKTEIYALDRDPTSHEYMKQLQNEYPGRVFDLIGRFSELPDILTNRSIPPNFFHGILMDLGASSMQFDTPSRGFMLSKDGPLDMRMDADRYPDMPTAAQILEHINEIYLYRVLKYYGQEKRARFLASAIVEARLLFTTLKTTKELADFISNLFGNPINRDQLGRFSHPATKTFQALRILVNNELNELDYGLRIAHYYMKMNGVLAAISFHSLEDTIVKRHLTGVDIDETPKTIGSGLRTHRNSLTSSTDDELNARIENKPWMSALKHVTTPTDEEILKNPRARSAKLRVAYKYNYPGDGTSIY